MNEEDTSCDQRLKIVNRTREYIVSKKFICSSVPYFEKMFCCDLLESKENKVVLDFDEHVFDSILNWIHTGSFWINMENVILFYEAADYLMINERLLKPCLSYFHDKFTIKHLPSVLSQVTKVSKLISSGSIENIICRYFLQIVNTDIFLNYPFETVEAILKLDLMVYSEYQIFDSIIKWVKKADSRKDLLQQLLDCVRWCFMDADDLSVVENNELIKALPNFKAIISSNVEYEFDRCKQRYFVSIQQMDEMLRIKLFDDQFFCSAIGDFSIDYDMCPEFFHEEHISDIFTESGSDGVRIDWIKKTFRWLWMENPGETYYSELMDLIVSFSKSPRAFSWYLDDKDIKIPDGPILHDEFYFLESNVESQRWFNIFERHKHSFHATVLDPVVYILTKDLEFIQFNYETKCFNKSQPFKNKKFHFDNLILTSHPKNDDKVILINKSTGAIYVFCINQEEWIEKYQILDVPFSSNSSGSSINEDDYPIIAFTPAFLSMKFIKPLYEQYTHRL
ncbi:uncharacterized protein LOC107361456 isoform X2 [Tetranychus urticae]|uniref:uncharacterized protein LOC107361456 isoform X2 n=1 Tax=Tetranychus urticae TaxID=32264 RepID=UPI00077BD97C|nr:uncharacterized protein LOC107361456 isoform X2 [Tetranychus urticae]